MRLVILLLAGCQFSVRGLPLPSPDLAQVGPGPVDDLAAVPDLSVSDDLAVELPDLTPLPDLATLPDLTVDPGPSSDVAEDVLATWDVGESTNDAPVPCAPMNLGHLALTADSTVVAGREAVNIAYTASSYFQAVYPKGLGASWDLRGRTSLEAWVQAVEPMGYGGWSPAGPTLMLCSPGGGYRAISPTIDQLQPSANAYTQLLIPLSTSGGWIATDVNFDASHVTGLELHFDPLCGACAITSVTVRIDNVFFH
jgi:hypothetical protein